MEDQLQKIVWIFVVQAFLLFYFNLLDILCLFFQKSRLFLTKSSKVIRIYGIQYVYAFREKKKFTYIFNGN